jgi:hypothetical protein
MTRGVRRHQALKNLLGWWKEIAEVSSEDEIKPIDWLVPVS